MRLARPLIAVAVTASMVFAGAASAAAKVKPTCNLITDASGDADDPLQTGVHLLSPINDGQVDILGGDLGSDKTTLTGVLRLASAPATDVHSPQGNQYFVEFRPSSSEEVLYLTAVSDVSGALTYYLGHITPQAGGVVNYGTFPGVAVKGKLSGTTITMTVPYAAIKAATGASVKPGSKFNDVKAETFGAASVPPPVDQGLLLGGDTTDPLTKPVIAGSPTCVKPVK